MTRSWAVVVALLLGAPACGPAASGGAEPRRVIEINAGSGDGAQDGCDDDRDCAWDDPCMPRFCLPVYRIRTAPERACAESRPPPGPCVCQEHRCAARTAAAVD